MLYLGGDDGRRRLGRGRVVEGQKAKRRRGLALVAAVTAGLAPVVGGYRHATIRLLAS